MTIYQPAFSFSPFEWRNPIWLFADRQANSASTQAYNVRTMNTALIGMRRSLFETLAQQWLEDTKWVSSMSRISGHSSLIAIVDMGTPAIRFLLERLKHGDIHIHWFIALARLVGDNKAAPASAGKLSAMAADWVDWGRREHYIA